MDELSAELSAFRDRYRALVDDIEEMESGVDWATPSTIAMEQGPMRLRRFEGPEALEHGYPLLVVYSHVNKPSVIDLDSERSLIRALQRGGNAVYLLEWKAPTTDDATNDLTLYLDTSIDLAVDGLLESHAVEQVNLLGICQGGTFGLCYASLHPEKIAAQVCMVTPVDFHAGDSLLSRWSTGIDFPALIERPANIPGHLITSMFQSMRPFDDMLRQISLIKRDGDEADRRRFAMRMDQWVFDCPDQPGRAFAQFAQQCFVDNALAGEGLILANNRVTLDRLSMPVLNVYATADHIVPAESASALERLINPDRYQAITFDGGHIGLLVSDRARREVVPRINEWLANGAEIAGDRK